MAENFARVRAQIEESAARVGRNPADIILIAVSKTVSSETVLHAKELGQSVFGENRVDELRRKIAACPGVSFHLIGTLQTNKVRHVVGQVELIHSVDSTRLLETIAQRAEHLGIVQRVLLQVNVSGEDTKHGFDPEEIERVLDLAVSLPHVAVEGLMTMAPIADEATTRKVFSDLRKLLVASRDYAVGRGYNAIQLKELSMGMSGDFQVAIEEGATLVRVGSALFVE